ncbi:MAG: WD40 repeat domain-containing protein, partial [Stackebrandtia sp.]
PVAAPSSGAGESVAEAVVEVVVDEVEPPAPAPPPEPVISTEPPAPAPMTTTPAEGPIVGLDLTGAGILAVARVDSVAITEPDGAAPPVVAREYDEPVASMSWSPGEPSTLAVATGPRITLWRKSSNVLESVRTITCPEDVALLNWSRRGLAAAADTEILVWDPDTGECVRTWRFSAGLKGARLRALAWSPDGSRLAAGGSLGSIKLWGESDEEPSTVLSIAPVGVRALAWSPDGDWLVSGDAAGGLRIWRLSDSSSQHIGQAHDAAVQTVSWSPDGKLLASGSIDRRIRLWDAGSGRDQGVLKGHSGTVTALCWTGDSHRLISGSVDGTIRQWDAANGTEVTASPPPHR